MSDLTELNVPGPGTDFVGHIRSVFAACKAASRPTFVAYTTCGFPTADVETNVSIIQALEKSGADIIELGVPFTDPLADGSTIQRANQIALDNGVNSVAKCLEIAKAARLAGVKAPFVFMGYYNPFRHYGEDKLVADAVDSGVNGFIISDLPPEESDEFRAKCRKQHLSYIPLIAPTTTKDRIKHLVSVADSFIYAVSLTGVTGARTELSDELPQFVKSIQDNTPLPIAVGFGISKPEHFKKVGSLADGCVVGSAIINVLDSNDKSKRIPALVDYIHNLTGRTEVLSVPIPHTRDAKPRDEVKASVQSVGSRFGDFGGRFVPETLVHALDELEVQYNHAKSDPKFDEEVKSYWDYIGRPSRLHVAERLTEYAGGATIWLKREDLNHTGAHKINNAIAQAILAKRLGKSRLIAETGAGQHGVATATICAKLGIPLTVYMGAEDVERQAPNVFRMKLLGATVIPVTSGSKTLKDAINEAMRDWVTNIRTTHYLIGSAIGPHPFPTIVRDFQSVIGQETKEQLQKMIGKLPDAVTACVGGGSNAIGMFYPFVNDKNVRLVGVEAGGDGIESGNHSSTLVAGTPGVLHGTRTYLLQHHLNGQINATHSISAGLDYPGVGPEHSYFKDIGRAEYVSVTDREALEGFKLMTEMEGIIPALETSHAIYHAIKLAKELGKGKNVVICVSGRGDKDLDTVTKALPKYGLDKTLAGRVKEQQ